MTRKRTYKARARTRSMSRSRSMSRTRNLRGGGLLWDDPVPGAPPSEGFFSGLFGSVKKAASGVTDIVKGGVNDISYGASYGASSLATGASNLASRDKSSLGMGYSNPSAYSSPSSYSSPSYSSQPPLYPSAAPTFNPMQQPVATSWGTGGRRRRTLRGGFKSYSPPNNYEPVSGYKTAMPSHHYMSSCNVGGKRRRKQRSGKKSRR